MGRSPKKRVAGMKEFAVACLRRAVKTDCECFLWQGTKDKEGYGVINFEGRQWRVHRLVFAALQPKKFDPRLSVCHKCNVKGCINPKHL